MKSIIQTVFISFGFALSGAMPANAASPKPPAPVVIKLAEILRQSDCITVYTWQTEEEGHARQIACLRFFFQTKSKAEVEALFDAGVAPMPPAKVVDGTNLIAQCSIVSQCSTADPLLISDATNLVALYQISVASRAAAEAGSPRGKERILYGLILRFGAVAETERTAAAMREDLGSMIRRQTENRSLWRIRASHEQPQQVY